MSHLLIHGTLHLLGFTHEQESAASLMETTEAKILRGLGVAAHAEALGA
jgi:probable rRNA maturation factor